MLILEEPPGRCFEMMEIAQLLESALADNRSSLRQAAKLTVSRMDPETTVDELLGSDAGDAVRDLTLSELKEALTKLVETAGLRTVATSSPAEGVVDQSQEERIYRRILEALADGPLTIGKLAKGLDMGHHRTPRLPVVDEADGQGDEFWASACDSLLADRRRLSRL